MQRQSMTVGTRRLWLAPTCDLDQVKEAATAAVRSGGGVIDTTIVGDRTVSVLISPGLPVVFESQEIEIDEADPGDVGFPFGDFTSDGLAYP